MCDFVGLGQDFGIIRMAVICVGSIGCHQARVLRDLASHSYTGCAQVFLENHGNKQIFTVEDICHCPE